MRAVFLYSLALFMMSGASIARASAVPYMDLLQYRSSLLTLRGKLPSQFTCAMDLRVREGLRSPILRLGHDFTWLVSQDRYTIREREADQAWAAKMATSIKVVKSQILDQLQAWGENANPWDDPNSAWMLLRFGFFPGFYTVRYFASYQVGGIDFPLYKPMGYVYKVFFEFKDPEKDLTPELYREFSRRLWKAGFKGDSKIPLMPGWIRLLWNNVIVHAPNEKSALIAERVGLKVFGPYLSSYSRGVDVKNELTNHMTLDWPDFLCVANPALIPPSVKQYLLPHLGSTP